MESYYLIFEVFGYLNSVLLTAYSALGIMVLKKSNNNILKTVAFYLLFSFCFDLMIRFSIIMFGRNFIVEFSSIFLKILFRLAELLIIGYLINKHWLKSKIVWVLIGASSLYLLYDLFTYRANGILNYAAYAQISANVLLVFLIAANLLKQLKDTKPFSVTNQMLCMVFLTYFSIHLIYTVLQNFIINQSFSSKSFALFYSSYAGLHIIYYFALAFILFKNRKDSVKIHSM